MKRLLIITFLLALPASAQAAEVTPEKQAALEQSYLTVADDEDSNPEAMLKNCAHGRAKGIGSRIRNAAGGTVVRGYLKKAVCANNGQITWSNTIYRYASPSRYWFGVGEPIKWNGSARSTSVQQWKHQVASIWQYWELDMRVVAHVTGDHGIWFSKSRKWS